jgi:hypothetical protein
VALTSTVSTACAGLTTVHVVIDAQLTDVPEAVPNLNVVRLVPGAKPVPVTVMLVPPALEPEVGLRLVIVGGPNL